MLNGPVTQEILKSSLSKEGAEILNESLVQEFIHEITKDNENSISIIKCLLEGKLTDEEISEEAMLRSERRKRITGYIQEKPGETSRLLKVWLAEE